MTLSDDTMITEYQSNLFSPFSDRLIYGFTGKPNSMKLVENQAGLLAELQLLHPEQAFLPWIIPEQSHSKTIGRCTDASWQDTDAVILTRALQPVMLMFADCVPVWLYHPESHSGALIHAGWQGTRQQITARTVQAFCQDRQALPQELIAVIGPSIGYCHFQVGADVALQLAQSVEQPLGQLESLGLFHWDSTTEEVGHIDVQGINAMQLEQSGVRQIETIPVCTVERNTRLFSHRCGDTGRNGAFLVLLP
jgi:polyphenol oxidase